MRPYAKCVVPQHLNNATFPSLAGILCLGQSHEFDFELRKNFHPSVNGSQLFARELVGRCAILCGGVGQSHQIRDIIKPEAQFPCMTQKGEPFERRCIVSPLSTRSSGG